MKNITKFLFATLAIAMLFTSCDMNTNGASAVEVDMKSTRGITLVDFEGAKVPLTNADVLKVAKSKQAKQNEDAVSGIRGTLLSAQNEAMSLEADVKFSMSDEPVEEGLFVFGIETEQEKALTLEMYDEEGFEMAANNTIKINKGDNYKALNVKSLDNGTYLFKLKDEAGKELTRQVTIQHQH